MLSKRIQVLFAPDEFIKLKKIADGEEKSIGSLIREAVQTLYLSHIARLSKVAVVRELRQLIKLDIPVDEPSEMKREIIAGRLKRG